VVKSDEQTHAPEPPIRSVLNRESLGGGPVMLDNKTCREQVFNAKLICNKTGLQRLESMADH